MKKDTYMGVAAMSLAGLSFASMAALMKAACRDLPPFEVIVFRGVVGFLLVAGWELARHGRLARGVARVRLLQRSLLGSLGLFGYVWAIAHIGLAEASALNQSSPVFVALLSIFLLRERTPALVRPLVIVAFGGVVLIVSPDFARVDWNALVGLGSGAASGAAYILVRQLRETDAPIVIVRWFAGWSVVLALPLALLTGWVWPSPVQLLALLGVGLFGLSGQMLMTFSYRWERAAVVSPFLYMATLGSVAFGWIFWDEFPSSTALVGVVLVVLASLGIGWLSSRR